MGQAVPENTAEKGPKSEAIPIQGRPHLSCGARRYLPRFCRRTATEHFVDQQVYKMTGTLNSIEQNYLPRSLLKRIEVSS